MYADRCTRCALERPLRTTPEWIQKKRFDNERERKPLKPRGVFTGIRMMVSPFSRPGVGEHPRDHVELPQPCARQVSLCISGYGFQSEGKPITFRVTAGTLKEVTEERLIDYFSVPADTPTVVEFTEQLEPENRIRILAEGLPALHLPLRKSVPTSTPPRTCDPMGRCGRSPFLSPGTIQPQSDFWAI